MGLILMYEKSAMQYFLYLGQVLDAKTRVLISDLVH